MKETVVLFPKKGERKPRDGDMTALLKPMELVNTTSSQLKTLCEVNYAASILRHITLIFATNSYKSQRRAGDGG